MSCTSASCQRPAAVRMPERRAAAIIRLADLRVRQGRLEEAGQLLKGLEQHPDAVRTLAAFHLARGDAALARDLLERATEVPDEEVAAIGASTMLGPLLALLVDVYLEQGWGTQAPLGWSAKDSHDMVSRTACAMLSDWMPSTTGEIVHVDGGYHAIGAPPVDPSQDEPAAEAPKKAE